MTSANSQHNSMPVFDYDFQSSEMAVRDALVQLLQALGPLALDVEEKGTIELVLAEVLNNIVEHAYQDKTDGGPIQITCRTQSDGLMVRITDKGKIMPEGKLPTGTLAAIEVDLDDMPEGGFGWFLIQNLAKDVTYERVRDKNVLHMRLAVGIT